MFPNKFRNIFVAETMFPSLPTSFQMFAARKTWFSRFSKDLPNMNKLNTFCDWLSETIVISVYDSFFRNYISTVLLSFIFVSSQLQRLFI